MAVAVSLVVHVAVLGVLMSRKAEAPLYELPTVEMTLERPFAIPKPKPEPRPKPVTRQTPPSPPGQPRPVEAPLSIPTSPLPAARAPRPPEVEPPPAATAQAAPRPLRLGCEGQDVSRMTQAQRTDCVRDLTSYARVPRPGETVIPPNARESEFAVESAAKEKKNQRMRPSGDAKHFGCKEANLGVGCTDDRMVPIWKQPF